MANFYLAANALVERDGKYLMIEEGKDYVKGTWNIPGGGVENDEDPVEAVKRELKEETGLDVTQINGLLGVYSSKSAKDGHPVKVFVFECETEDETPEPELEDEILDAKFMDVEEIREKELRNDIIFTSIENKQKGKKLPVENFEGYKHPYLEEEP